MLIWKVDLKQLPHPKHVINFLCIISPLMLRADSLSQYINIKFLDSVSQNITHGIATIFRANFGPMCKFD